MYLFENLKLHQQWEISDILRLAEKLQTKEQVIFGAVVISFISERLQQRKFVMDAGKKLFSKLQFELQLRKFAFNFSINHRVNRSNQ